MTQERDNPSQSTGYSPAGSNGSGNPFDKRVSDTDEPQDFDTEHDVYEEPDRDTDGSASFYEHSIEEEPDYDSTAQASAGSAPGAGGLSQARTDEGMDELDDDLDFAEDDWDEPDMSPEQESEAWLDERNYAGDEAETGQAWPLGLIAVAVVALVLLIAGGYGVMQQRSATQEEIRELRAALATAASPEEVAESRSAAAEAEQRNVQLKEQLYTLSAENRRLADTVAGLESQLTAQQQAIAKAISKSPSAAAKPAAKPTPKPAPAVAKAKPAPKPAAKPAAKPAPRPTVAAKPKPVTTVATPTATVASAAPGADTWFVNFGSYGSADVAQGWVKKLNPAAGRVITAPGEKNGRTFYRVRVVDLPDKAAAQNVARGLERDYSLPKLWIGKQP